MKKYYHVSLRERKIIGSFKSTAPHGSRSFDSLEESKKFIKDNEIEFKKQMDQLFNKYELTEVEIKE